MNRDEQVSRNIELAGRFLDHLLEHPAELAEQPDRQSVVLIPEDDEELAEANVQMARRLIQKGTSRRAALKPNEESAEGAEDGETKGICLHAVRP